MNANYEWGMQILGITCKGGIQGNLEFPPLFLFALVAPFCG